MGFESPGLITSVGRVPNWPLRPSASSQVRWRLLRLPRGQGQSERLVIPSKRLKISPLWSRSVAPNPSPTSAAASAAPEEGGTRIPAAEAGVWSSPKELLPWGVTETPQVGPVPAPDVSLAPRRRGSAYAQTRPPSQPAQRALANFPRPEPARVYTCSRYNRKRTSTRSHLPLGCWRVPRSRVRVSTGSAAASPRDCRPQPWGSVLTTPGFGGALAGPPVLVYTSSATPGHRRCFGSRAPPAPPMALETLQSADPAEIPRSRCAWPVPAVAPGSRPRRNCRGCLPGPRPHAPVRAAPPPLSHILRYRRWRKKML